MEPQTNFQSPEPVQNEPIQKQNSSALIISIAIIVATLMICATIIAKSFIDNNKKVVDTTNPLTDGSTKVNIAPITNKDHILGNPKAKILIVEYSDTECPFCKQFHVTMKQIMDTFGKDGSVAWVYRHFPLYKGTETQPPLHPQAGKQAEATECAAELGGNDKFWAYLNRIYEITPSNNGLAGSKLYDIATEVGLNKADFQTCVESGRYANKISADYDAAIAAGARGTPFTVILDTRTGTAVPIEGGAVPYLTLKAMVQMLLGK